MDVLDFNYINISLEQEPTSSFSVVEILPLIIAIIAIIFPVWIYIYTKKKEIEYEKFKILAVENLNIHFQAIEDELNTSNASNKSRLRLISSAITNLNLFVITILSKEYQNIDKQSITSKIDIFSDFILNNSQQVKWNHEFHKIKFEVMSELYDYALEDKRFYNIFKSRKKTKNKLCP